MKKLLFLILLMPLMVFGQTAWTTSPSGYNSIPSPAFRFKVNSGSDNSLLIYNSLTGWYNQVYTATQSDLRYAPIGSGVVSFNTRTGAVALLSADITGALGFTPLSNSASVLPSSFTSSSLTAIGNLTTGGVPYSLLIGTVPTWNQNTTGTALNITSSINSTLTTLSTLSLPYSQLTGAPSIPTGANPTATAGATVVNGSATSFMRSDAAPKIDSTAFQTVLNFFPKGDTRYLKIGSLFGLTPGYGISGSMYNGSAARTWTTDTTVVASKPYVSTYYQPLIGILSAAHGGTGTNSPGIVAGTNITVSGTWPNQTINASGGSGISGLTTNYYLIATSGTTVGNGVIYNNSGSIGVNINTTAVGTFDIASTSTATIRGALSSQFSTDALGAKILLFKYRGTPNSPTTGVTGDTFGSVDFGMYEGTNPVVGSKILSASVGTVGTGNISGTMTFQTANAGTLKNAILIDQNQSVGIGAAPFAGSFSILGQPISYSYPFLSYWAFGDSITVGYGSSLANAYATLIGTAIGHATINKALIGNYAADEVDSVYSVTPSNTNQLYSLMIGTNDANNYTTTNQSLTYKQIIAAEATYLLIPNSSKVIAQSGGSYTGTWVNSTYYSGAMGKYSQTNGSTVTFTTTGSVAYIAYTMLDGNTGTFTTTIDGTGMGTTTAAGVGGATISTTHGRTYADGLLRFSGLSSGSHTIVLTVTSTTGAGNKVFFDWAAGNSGAGTSGWPAFFENNISVNNIPTKVSVYNPIISANIATLSGDGFNAHFVDVAASTANYSLYNSGDGIHPNTAGQLVMYNSDIAAIKSFGTTAGNIETYNSNIGQGLHAITNAGFHGIGTNTPQSPLTIQTASSAYDAAPSSASFLPTITLLNSTGSTASEIRYNINNVLSFGLSAGLNLTTAANDFINGYQAALTATTSSNDFINGYQAGYSITTGGANNLIGNSAGYLVTTGTDNNAFGYHAMYGNSGGMTGQYNNCFGWQAGANLSSGSYNNFFGYQAGQATSSGSNINAFGQGAGFQNTGSNNNFFGYQTSYAVSSSAGNNNFMGYQAGYTNQGANNNFIGPQTGFANTSGNNNDFIGNGAGFHNVSGSYVDFVGSAAGLSSTGSYNAGFGASTLHDITSGQYNIAMGYQAGMNSTTSLTSINNSIFLGALSTSNVNTITNAIVIGYGAIGHGSNTATYGSTSITDSYFYGNTKFAPLVEPNLTSATNSTSGGSGLSPTTTYYYIVVALDKGGNPSGISNQRGVITGAGATNSNTINWNSVTGNYGYRIYQGTTSLAQTQYLTAAQGATSIVDIGSGYTTGSSLPVANSSYSAYVDNAGKGWFPNVNISGLTASSMVYTDASSNLTTTAPGGVAVIHGNSTTTGTATTAVTVTIGSTMNNANYFVSITPKDLLTAVNYYISAQSTTQFTVTFVTGLTGSINFDWNINP